MFFFNKPTYNCVFQIFVYQSYVLDLNIIKMMWITTMGILQYNGLLEQEQIVKEVNWHQYYFWSTLEAL